MIYDARQHGIWNLKHSSRYVGHDVYSMIYDARQHGIWNLKHSSRHVGHFRRYIIKPFQVVLSWSKMRREVVNNGSSNLIYRIVAAWLDLVSYWPISILGSLSVVWSPRNDQEIIRDSWCLKMSENKLKYLYRSANENKSWEIKGNLRFSTTKITGILFYYVPFCFEFLKHCCYLEYEVTWTDITMPSCFAPMFS